ncbi:MAG TPA: hypothetical protein VEQ85_08975 [Lacipirellulaceae bacterium]|nr:hypothetical protein [Lacipirellulaceae bacterium]
MHHPHPTANPPATPRAPHAPRREAALAARTWPPVLAAAALLLALAAAAWPVARAADPRPIDVRRLAAAGLRMVEGQHLRLVTDLPPSPAVDELPEVFDAAVPLWCEYFGVAPAQLQRQKFLGFLVSDRQQFAALGLLPAERPDFPSGYANGWEFWLAEQPSDYYRRHLLLHEGTHAFMHTQLGGAGAPWYMEGMAELLGAHSWHAGQLTLGVMPPNRESTPMWGRIKLIRDAAAARQAWPLERVLAIDNSRLMGTDEYAWAWALAVLLEQHPQFHERFALLRSHAADPKFPQLFRAAFAPDWSDLQVEWQALTHTIDYGYDVPTMAMLHAESAPVERATRRSKVAANRGWQSSGWTLRAGQRYQVTGRGRFQLVRDGETWPCEAGGVTIQYHAGRPSGELLGAWRYVDGGGATFDAPMSIGLEANVLPERDAVLYLRVNDSPARAARNTGSLEVRIRAAD